MKKRSFLLILGIVGIIVSIVLELALVFDQDTTKVVKLVLSPLLLPLILCGGICLAEYYKSHIHFGDTKVEISGRKGKNIINYNEIREIRYVVRNYQISTKEKGMRPETIQNYDHRYAPYGAPYYARYYDIISVNGELMATIDLIMWKEQDIIKYFLIHGIPVHTEKEWQQPKRRRMTGEMLEILSNQPMQTVCYQEIEDYLNQANQKIRLKNSDQFSIGKNITVLGVFLLLIYCFSGFLSFLVTGIVCILTGAVFARERKRLPYMQRDNTYEAGWVYWGMGTEDFLLYFKGKTMERRKLEENILLQSAKINELNYCVINYTCDIVVIGVE